MSSNEAPSKLNLQLLGGFSASHVDCQRVPLGYPLANRRDFAKERGDHLDTKSHKRTSRKWLVGILAPPKKAGLFRMRFGDDQPYSILLSGGEWRELL